MSIALLIRLNSKDTLVPVATEDAFKNVWAPHFQQIDSKWLRQFDAGITIDSSNSGAVIDELEQLRGRFRTSLAPPDFEKMIQRLDGLIAAIRLHAANPGAELWIG